MTQDETLDKIIDRIETFLEEGWSAPMSLRLANVYHKREIVKELSQSEKYKAVIKKYRKARKGW